MVASKDSWVSAMDSVGADMSSPEIIPGTGARETSHNSDGSRPRNQDANNARDSSLDFLLA
jgi:hypothetical protein